jgi:two-component sensor histidine kinase/putative methionine-R-sulfoxide reductase with GAF domain
MQNENEDTRSELLEQQSTLARFGELALRSDDLDEILGEACSLVGRALGTNLAKILELQQDGTTLLVRAGVGWGADVVGKATIAVGPTSSAGHAMSTGEAVVSADIENDNRFEYPDFLRRAGVRAAVNTIIIGPDGEPPYGVLEVDSKTAGRFSEDDIHFLRTYANLIASAVARLRMIAQLRSDAQEKTQLLNELRHRVKNNLQAMTSLVRLQQRQAGDGEAAAQLEAVAERIEALGLVHDQLYGSVEMAPLSLASYLRALGASLLRFRAPEAGKTRLIVDAQEIQIEPRRALPLGLIVNEFIVNSLKHAFEGDEGTIGIRLEDSSAGARLILWDDGKGLPHDRRGGLGMQLIAGFAQQIGAALHWDTNGGTRLSVTIPHS